jgi:hypothetical protein
MMSQVTAEMTAAQRLGEDVPGVGHQHDRFGQAGVPGGEPHRQRPAERVAEEHRRGQAELPAQLRDRVRERLDRVPAGTGQSRAGPPRSPGLARRARGCSATSAATGRRARAPGRTRPRPGDARRCSSGSAAGNRPLPGRVSRQGAEPVGLSSVYRSTQPAVASRHPEPAAVSDVDVRGGQPAAGFIGARRGRTCADRSRTGRVAPWRRSGHLGRTPTTARCSGSLGRPAS